MRTWTFKRFGVVKQLATDRHVIMCDFDRSRDLPKVRVMRALCNRLGLRIQWFRQDKNPARGRRPRRGWHLVVRFVEPLTRMERIAVQLLCGSDRTREGLNFMRARSLSRYPSRFWGARWNLLFERKL